MHAFTLALSAVLVLVCLPSAVVDILRLHALDRGHQPLGLSTGLETPTGLVKSISAIGLLIGRGSGPVTLAAAC